MTIISSKNLMKVVFMAILAICLFGPKLGVNASEVQETYPLPAPIIEAFPDEDIAEWVAFETGKDSVNDTITQEDLDNVEGFMMEGVPFTGEQLAILNNEIFPNVTLLSIEGGEIGDLPVFTAFPNIEKMELSNDHVTSFPDADYSSLKSVDLSFNDLSGAFPMFVGMDGLQNINLFDCNITDIPLDAWSNLTDLGNNDGNVNLSENHIIEIPESITYSHEWGFPVTAVNEFYTYDPITIQQGESHPLYLPIVKQYWDQGIAMMGKYSVDGQSEGYGALTPEDYYIPIPTEELTVGIHILELDIKDYYGSNVTGGYTILVNVE
ncbi:internalin N-terminal domain-containing protein [Listeria seeligeri]|uniref:internalin N-terminal domain-containing protein n=1 Tax=Listeria seeligeri TaxID=1640 RepID=UPI0015E66D2C|nr:internalin [Listeria seeligeri]MBC1576956.1 internalin [Listeria seeligeri]MBC1592271.1 internalin [Listeria seeligeri]MBC1915182.1 internalin [Listeria seeligeri]MBC2197085.1 internalin [Listeria seeligeri]MBC2211338.1 internalin [Listeria seeligeri]